jgi:hypothetical protein
LSKPVADLFGFDDADRLMHQAEAAERTARLRAWKAAHTAESSTIVKNLD